jgi:type VI secretion system protein ImpA
MSSPSLLEIEPLLAPIPGDDPAGAPVSYDVRAKLEEDRKEEDPNDYPVGDPMRPDKPKKADWSGILRLGQETLTKKSKDLLVAARMLEALCHLHGFAGLTQGLKLLRELIAQCWDRLYPAIEDGDLEVRAGPFFWLDDPALGARFPSLVRRLPFDGQRDGYGWLDWRQSQAGLGRVSREDFEKAMMELPREKVQGAVDQIAQAQQELTSLIQVLDQRLKALGSSAPSLHEVKQAVDDCQRLAEQILGKRSDGAPAGDGEGTTATDGAAPAGTDGARGATRSELYRQLAQTAARLQSLEPHSPIPYLIRRAVELGGLPFPQLIKALVRDANVLSELNREFGLEPPAPPTP